MNNALNLACYKGEQKRNEISIDLNAMWEYESIMSENCLSSFENFMTLVNKSIIDIKRFTVRNLMESEQRENYLSGNYKVETGEENILRGFRELSSDSKKENLEAAIGAYNVFEQLSQAGVSIEAMKCNDSTKQMIGLAIHTDWLKRNKNHSNDSLKVPYGELDDWTKQQDITVFEALLTVVEQNGISISPIAGYKIPDYLLEEREILQQIKKNFR